MRITNKIMQNNNLANINTNKIYQDNLSNQMSTQKKITKPSDDPVVAIRALRLRSSVTEITQYYSKNIPDAESWLSVTEDALSNLSQIITNMISECTRGSNGDLTTKDRQIILEQLKALGDEIYTTGDSDYAGRYVFTGYRTDRSLRFPAETEQDYTITEHIKCDTIDTVNHVEYGKLMDLNGGNYQTMTDVKESAVSSQEVHRIRLSYDECAKGATISFQNAAGKTVTWSTDRNLNPNARIKEANSYDEPNPYKAAAEDDNALIYLKDTGEILLGKNRYETLMNTKDKVETTEDEALISVTYNKSSFDKNDLRPEHYFQCTSDGVEYNPNYADATLEKQAIEYDVGFNQTVRVNTTAEQCFKHGIGRTVDDLVGALTEVLDLEESKTKIKGLLDTESGDDAKLLQQQYDAVEKALTLSKDKCQKLFEKDITAFQGYLDDTNLCITDCGTRSSKLSLIKNRMQNQKTTFETLKSENEDIDIAEVAIQLSSAGMTYEAALMATGKVMQTSLLNFI